MPTHLFAPLEGPDADNGKAIGDLFERSGPGTTILLIPGQVYRLTNPIYFKHPFNTLATDGYPLFESGAQAILETRGEKESGAVNMLGLEACALMRVHIRGCRGWGRGKPADGEIAARKARGELGWLEGGAALVLFGGAVGGEDQVMEGCRLEDPRGWTACHCVDWTKRGKILNNIVGPCGQEAPAGPWADGLSIAGLDCVVSGNVITDATDGAIVLFCATGTQCTSNTIIAAGRDLLGAINMVDAFPMQRNFKGTRVVGNTIRGDGAFVRMGIGCGPTVWAPWSAAAEINYGGSVEHNLFGGRMGYAVALSGVSDWVARGNALLPGARFQGDTGNCITNAPPRAFLTQWPESQRVVNCTFGPEFVEGEASWLIGVEANDPKKLRFEEGQLEMTEARVEGIADGGLRMWGADFVVTRAGRFALVDDAGKTIWSSPASSTFGPAEGVLKFHKSGAFSVAALHDPATLLWDPLAYLSNVALPPVQGHKSLTLSVNEPYLSLADGKQNILFATSYKWAKTAQWQLQSGQWIAIAPAAVRGEAAGGGPPPVPLHTRPGGFGGEGTGTFLWLDPNTHQVVLHTSRSPTGPQKVHWCIPADQAPKGKFTKSWAQFQWDGNFVLYAASPKPRGKEGEDIAVRWASNTAGDDMNAGAVFEVSEDRVEIKSEKGETRYSSAG